MSWLSPVQWAKWTWSAMKGAGEDELEENNVQNGEIEEEEDEEEERSQSFRQGTSHDSMTKDQQAFRLDSSDSEGQFETPETESPVHQPLAPPTKHITEEDVVSITVTSELKLANQDNGPKPETNDLDCNSLLPEIPKMKSPLIPESTEVETVTPSPVNVDDIPLPKKTYTFEPEKELQVEDDAGSQKQGSKTENDIKEKPTETEPGCDVDDVPLPENSYSLEQTSEFQDNNRECKKSPSQKRGKKPGTKPTSKKQKPKAMVVENDTHTSLNVDEIPLPKTSYNFDPSQWDDPNFDPFGGKNKVRNSPTLPQASYDFNPDNFDDSQDAFKPSNKITGSGDSERTNDEKTKEDENKGHPLMDERNVRQSPKKSKDKIITNTCKVKKYENTSLALDVCKQVEEEQEEPVRHATDEEKLASTCTMQKHDKTSKTLKLEDDLEVEKKDHFPEKEICTPSESLEKTSPNLDSIALSEMDKAAVLTLIREEIITKEIEANEWKRKYEESRMEVLEMRKIVAEYEKTVAQMIEDEQRKNMGSQKSVQQLITERDQALSDLNSVERSLSDLFRRYENMKTVLEGFKKNEEVLKKCAQEYLARVKQEEQRYNTLKIHAEEKLDKANEEIAQVRARSNAECVALNASLRKEQMKVESLERALEQKNQEIEELTKICDELIAKLGTTT
ncbi:transforming acidic coiled-coil-containing protein 1 isoform X2 [Pangasianodon hypophthalmus]|uniref:transforming acidic coiled-coil-containing protein 1 isoform X2 n=1 Tax=Pangasianodon hypophthalmus TaxID=310915 RepID=UPI002306EABF|nr:transforming acidic coiled-coil-containing protein 1 isoform X2 [Pangasianodon hypophthalmus]